MAADGTSIPEGGLVSVVSVGEDMTARFNEQLPFGRYYVQEISTDEKYVISGEKHIVTFEYAGQDTEVVDIEAGEFINDLDRGSVHGQKVSEHDEPLANAVFGIFRTNCEVFNADNAIATAISDENGIFEINEIPYGSYIVTEIQAPVGYVFSDKKYDVVIDKDGDVVNITAENDEIELHISKKDVYGNELAGATMQLISDDGSIFDEWVSDGTEHIVTKLPAGSYVLHEVAAPDGFVITTDIAFTIDEHNKVTVDKIDALATDENGIPTIIMVDDTTKVHITKTDITGDKELKGAKLQVIDENGNVVDEWTSTTEAHIIEGELIAGKEYTLHEEISPDGYVVANDITFTVSEDGSVDLVNMKDDTTKVHISKTDITGDKELDGAKLQVIDENGNVVDEWISTTEEHIIEGKLVAGKEYTLHEEISPDGYVVANDITFKVSEDGSVDVVVMKDETTKVRISKRDITTDEELPGAKLIIIDEDGNTIEEWTSTSEAHYIEGKLIVGKTYTLREITAPDGYEIANDIQFKVNEDGSVTEVVMYDKHKPDESVPDVHNPHTGSDLGGVVNGSLAMMAVCGSIMVVSKRKKEQEVDE
ncbi:MAG: NPXTG-anchored protein [Ruminococcus sp.]|nr:NPXTG-anchored protein [Ruminococcus sp.]